EVPTIEMSHIYVEAIRITRALGIQFLWIDSLCIIQDSLEDWEREASRMATVYGAATCNLSYFFPPEDAKKEVQEDSREYTPCILCRPSISTTGVYATTFNFRSYWMEEDKWPLLERAWVMQERLLCPRNIFLGNKSRFWECSQIYCSDVLGIRGGNLMYKIAHFDNADANCSPSASEECYERLEFLTSWKVLCRTYWMQNLAFETDRVIAFAGIAEAVQRIHNLTYIAGLWLEYLQPGLLWYVIRDAHLPVKHPTDHIPSWSWLS
ncbi:hypothetical protein BU23DRAFT_438502, partial [Bimuria novae-zelandiae CBS 107.79]